MDTNNPVSIKASMFGGYKKKDVLSYIFELNESTQDAQQKFAEQIEELSQSREALVKELAETQTKLASVQTELDEVTAKLEEENQKSDEASSLAEKYKREADSHFKNAVQKDGELQRYSALNAELTEKNRILEEKRGDVELAASQIANLLGKAQADSDKLLEDAGIEAEKIKADARKEADIIVKKAEIAADKRVKDANSIFDRVHTQFEGFCSELDAMKTSIMNTTTEINEKVEAFSASVEKTRTSMPEPFETSVSLSYAREEASEEELASEEEKSADEAVSVSDKTSPYANDILNKYGVRRDDSGFFRLAAER